MAEQKSFDLKAMMAGMKELDVNDLNNIDWENMGSWSAAGKMVFCALLFVAVLIGGYFYFIADAVNELEAQQQREVTLKQDFENKAFRVSNLDAYKAQLVDMEETFGTLLKQLPRDTEVPGLIDDISAAALTAGLNLNIIDPQAMKRSEFYIELPINIEVTGAYHEMGAFVSSVASLPRIVTLHDFTIEKQSNSNSLIMKIEAKTYQYSADTLASPAARGK